MRAVIDWEMSTLGDPLTDVALLLVYDRLSEVAGGSAVADAALAPGYPGPDEQLEQYAAASGRDLDRMDFHLGLAYLKLAVILEGIHYRHLQGQTVGAGFDSVGDAVEPLLTAGLDATRALDRTTEGTLMDFAYDARTEELRERTARLHGRARLPGRAGLPRAARGPRGPLGLVHGPGARGAARRGPQRGLWNLFLPARARRPAPA